MPLLTVIVSPFPKELSIKDAEIVEKDAQYKKELNIKDAEIAEKDAEIARLNAFKRTDSII